MNEQIRSISLIVIAICLLAQFIMQIAGGDSSQTINTKEQNTEKRIAPTTNTQTNNPAIVQPAGTGANQTPVQPKPKNAPDIPETTMAFSELDHDFGKVKQGFKGRHTFEITNTGNNPLRLYNISGDHGAIVISYTKEDIPPGQKGTIVAELNTELSGPGEKKIIVHVNANATPVHSHIHLSAIVE